MSLSTIAETPLVPDATPPDTSSRRIPVLIAALAVGAWFETIRASALFKSSFMPIWMLASLGFLIAVWSVVQSRPKRTFVSVIGTTVLALVSIGLIVHLYKAEWLYQLGWVDSLREVPATVDVYNYVVLIPTLLGLACLVPIVDHDELNGASFAPNSLRSAFFALLRVPGAMVDALLLARIGSRSGWTGSIWGVVLSIPVCAVLVALLSADSQFQHATKYLEDIFGSSLAHVIWALVFAFLTGTFLSLFRKSDEASTPHADRGVVPPPAYNETSWWDSVRSGPAMNSAFVSFFVPVAALFAIYAVANLPSFFITDADIRGHGGPTYATHLHRGFDESVIASMLACALIWAELWMRGTAQLPSRAIVWMQSVLLVLASFAVISCGERLMLYVFAYGLTPKRIFVGFFVIVALGTFALTARKVVHRDSTRLSGDLYSFYAITAVVMGLFPYFLVPG